LSRTLAPKGAFMHKAVRYAVLVFAVAALAACGPKIGDNPVVKIGQKVLAVFGPRIGDKMVVKIGYKGSLADGSEFDASSEGSPLEFMVGGGQMIPKFEENLIGLKKGDTKTFTIAAADAYGERDEAMLIPIPLSAFPKDLKLEVGLKLSTVSPTGEPMIVSVAELRKDAAVIDYNHPLAGKDLTFAIEVVDVRKPTREELSALPAPAAPVAR
jgi:peptidylprolyl isomerase